MKNPELSDVRRKRTRRPPHTGRSPRGFEKEQQQPATPSPAPQVLVVKQQQQQQQQRASPAMRPGSSMTMHSDFGTAPVDAGYEEVAFTTASAAPQYPHYRPASKLESPITKPPAVRTTPPKKPLGILKTPGVYATNHPSTRNEAGRLSTLAGYVPGETWPAVQKNVQWDAAPKEDDWDPKIDESKVVKEFSYQYIRQEEVSDEPNNLVQSRIRSFETAVVGTPEKDTTGMQEPLKVSPPQTNTSEAHVSRLSDSPRKPSAAVIREFALGEQNKNRQQEESDESDKQLDRNKSVKDLLADFERKSQQVQQQEHDKQQKDVAKHRGVFSDTETLLYETGSDLDQPDEEESEQIVPKYKDQPEEKQRKSAEGEKPPARGAEEPVNPAYMRLSVTESLVTHGDQLSGESENASPTPKQSEESNMEEHYLPMTPRKSILDPNAEDRPMPKMMESLFANLREESSYVEMTQNGATRSLLAPESGDGKPGDYGDYSTLDNPHYEFVCVADNKMEPVYMEVNQLGDKDDKSKSGKKELEQTGNLPDILTALKSDSSDADDESSKDLDSIDAPRHPRFSLSDTFRPASYYLGASQTLIAELHDSSDSEIVSPPPIPTSPPPMEELDSLEHSDPLDAKNKESSSSSVKSWNKPAAQVEVRGRSPTRFSDAGSSFRDSRASLESASGSDSAELRNPEEEARHRQLLKRRPVSDDVCEVLDSLDELESLGSRFDGASIDLDQYLEELQARDAFNVGLYAKDLSYNSIYGLNENILVQEKLHKTGYPEPKSSESNNSLDQPFRYGTRSKTSSASSLPSMRVSEVPPTASHQHSQSFTGDAHYENISRFSPLRASPATISEDYRPPKSSVPSPLANVVATHSRDSSYSFVSGTASVANYSAQRPASAQHSPVQQSYTEQRTASQQQPYHSRSASQDSARYSLSPNHRSSSSQDSSLYPASTSTVVRAASTNPGQDQSGAPYYYSDLQGAVETQRPEGHPRPCAIAHTSRLPQLNNQRDDAAGLNKRNDIGRIVNPIPRQMPRQIQVDDIDEARRIAAELRKTTCQLLAEDKAALVDRRNFYESDTLRRVKSTEPMPDVAPSDLDARNLYPHGLKDKSGSQTQLSADSGEFAATAQTSHRRSRSLEGLLDDAGLQSLVEQRSRANRQQQQQTAVVAQQAQPQREPQNGNRSENNRSNGAFEGEDPWEQDSLWRESLRRVSLRHARSLDNLDTPATTTTTTPQILRSAAPETSRSQRKITRGVTYVNDSVASRVKRENSVKPSAEDNEDDAYESLAMDRIGAGGYIWDPENEAYRKPPEQASDNAKNPARQTFLGEGNPAPATRDQPVTSNNSSSSSFEIDREKLRQWDLLSSACLLQEQQRTSMALADACPGRGLPAATAQSAAATGCASVADASSGRSEQPTTNDPRQEDEEVKRLVLAARNGAGEWLYRAGAGLAYRK